MTNYKKKDGGYMWVIEPEDEYTLVRNVIPAMIWGRGCRLYSVNHQTMYRGADQFSRCVVVLYRCLRDKADITMEADIVGCRCIVNIKHQESDCVLTIAIANEKDKDTKIERKMLRHINSAMNTPKDICFPDLQN